LKAKRISLGLSPSYPPNIQNMKITLQQTDSQKLKTRRAKKVSIEISGDEISPSTILNELLLPSLSALGYNETVLARIHVKESASMKRP